MPKKIVTHNAIFHSDDVFAVATALLIYPDAEVIRTRDEDLIRTADIVLDVGEIYDADKNRFDHHQFGGAGDRENGIPYSSFGLIWKKFGEEITGSRFVMERIDQSLVQAIDAGDNGVDLFKPLVLGAKPYHINKVIDQYRPTWKEGGGWDERFLECVGWANGFLKRLIQVERDMAEGENVVLDAYRSAPDKRLVVIDEKYDLGRGLVTQVLSNLPEPFYVVLYRHDHQQWQLVAVRMNNDTFDLRKPLPESWAATHDAELEKESGVIGALFCHRRCFMCTAKTREAAIELAQAALNS